MSVRGRKPKPTAIKKLEGNPGKRELNTREPKPPEGLPTCPVWLMPEAKREWRRLAKSMFQAGVLTEWDRAAFALYCQAYARCKEAEQFLDEHGTVFKTQSEYIQQLPQVSIAQTYSKLMSKLAAEFGLTPAARSRIIASGIEPVKGKGVKDEMDELLSENE